MSQVSTASTFLDLRITPQLFGGSCVTSQLQGATEDHAFHPCFLLRPHTVQPTPWRRRAYEKPLNSCGAVDQSLFSEPRLQPGQYLPVTNWRPCLLIYFDAHLQVFSLYAASWLLLRQDMHRSVPVAAATNRSPAIVCTVDQCAFPKEATPASEKTHVQVYV
ncbi:hypothetical protein V5799_016264 [Amblyomma americanum]|uniref:Uncharacterized protein n=1 Tax=Amblyomma americanum TaxID=6943 RepID=A0AAQ4F6Q5_AMBAM